MSMTGVGKLILTKDNLESVIHGLCAMAVVICIILGTGMPVLSYVAFAITLAYLLLAQNERAISLMFFLLPFGNTFKTSPSSASFFTYLTIFLALKLFLSKRMLNKYFLIAWAALFMIQVIGCDMDYSLLIKQATILLLIYGYFRCCKPITKEIVLNLTVGMLLSCCIAFMTDLFPGLDQYMRLVRVYEVSAELYRFSGLYADPNYLTQMLVMLCVSLFVLMQCGKIDKIGWLFCAAMIFFGVQTLSKSFFLMLGVLMVVLIAMAFYKKRYGLVALILLGVCTIVPLLISRDVTYFDNIFKRLSFGNDITTGRFAIWKEYITFFVSNPLKLLFGGGISAEALRLLPHSTYFDFLYYYGIFGTTVFTIGLFYAVRHKSQHANILNSAPALCYGIMAAFLSNLLSFDFGYALILMIAFFTDDMSPLPSKKEGAVLTA